MSVTDDGGVETPFDLTAFLWGDLPLVTDATPAPPPPPKVAEELIGYVAAPPPPPPPPSVGVGVTADDVVTVRREPDASAPAAADSSSGDWAATDDSRLPGWSLESAPPPVHEAALLGADPSDAGHDDLPQDGLPAELLLDLPDLDLLPVDDEAEDAEDADLPTLSGERELGFAALTDRLHDEVLPRLRGYVATRGYLTLGHLSYAVGALQGSVVHLEEVRAFVRRSGMPLFPSRSHHGPRDLPLRVYQQTLDRFGDLVHGVPDESRVIEQFGYSGISLSDGSRRFLVQAWLCHCLSRVEEAAHCAVVGSEMARVGVDRSLWSADALVSREALVVDNLSLVAREARLHLDQGVDVDDLLQAGALGLFGAIEKFDPSHGLRFVHYAGWRVRQSIQRHIADHARTIRLPVHVQESGKHVAGVTRTLRDQTGHMPTVSQVVAAIDGIDERVVRAILVTSRTLSLDLPTTSACIDRRYSTSDEEWFDEIVAQDREGTIRDVIQGLSPREQHVMHLRFGLWDEKVHTLEEVGRELGVTRERIRQIEANALRKLNHPRRLQLLRDYLDAVYSEARSSASIHADGKSKSSSRSRLRTRSTAQPGSTTVEALDRALDSRTPRSMDV